MKTLKKLLSRSEKKFTFFVVEDSDIYRELVSIFIHDINDIPPFNEKVNYEIHSFRSGEECMKELTNKKPDIVVLDYQLDRYEEVKDPRTKRVKLMNGVETLKSIKKILPSVEAIIVTSKGDYLVNSEAIAAGAAEYIEKSPGIREKFQKAVTELMKKISGPDQQPLVA